jgi:hypothetical protein
MTRASVLRTLTRRLQHHDMACVWLRSVLHFGHRSLFQNGHVRTSASRKDLIENNGLTMVFGYLYDKKATQNFFPHMVIARNNGYTVSRNIPG